jgi:hypothetical protein
MWIDIRRYRDFCLKPVGEPHLLEFNVKPDQVQLLMEVEVAGFGRLQKLTHEHRKFGQVVVGPLLFIGRNEILYGTSGVENEMRIHLRL